MIGNWTVKDKMKAQREYCEKHDLPRFAPYDGRCFSCGRNVYEYYDMEKCASDLIVRCPYCNYSFCD